MKSSQILREAARLCVEMRASTLEHSCVNALSLAGGYELEREEYDWKEKYLYPYGYPWGSSDMRANCLAFCLSAAIAESEGD